MLDNSASPVPIGTTAAVLLAAGSGTRFTGASHKLLASLKGRRVIDWSVSNVLAAIDGRLMHELLVVTSPDLRPLLDLPIDPRLKIVINPDAAAGQATSLHVALLVAAQFGHVAVVTGLADQPFIPTESWLLVAAAQGTPIAVATYDGNRRNPVRLASEVWPHVPTHGDEGARSLLRLRPEWVTEVPSVGNPADIDTMEDLGRWNS
jgi:molybdenum cofactor cytidylyltransferase